jgi:hypothetical protein
MKFIQHRANDHKMVASTPFAEIDVWVCDDGSLKVKHDVKGDPGSVPPIHLQDYLRHSPYQRYFVDIKQSLCDEDYLRIIKTIGRGRLIGLFDIPWPAYHRLVNLNLPAVDIYARYSEHERSRGSGHVRNLWLDPLDDWSAKNYCDLICDTDEEDAIIVASPELHGRSKEEAEKVWEMLGIYKFAEVVGIVTKWPTEAEKGYKRYD